jgi:hypothetical protein
LIQIKAISPVSIADFEPPVNKLIGDEMNPQFAIEDNLLRYLDIIAQESSSAQRLTFVELLEKEKKRLRGEDAPNILDRLISRCDTYIEQSRAQMDASYSPEAGIVLRGTLSILLDIRAELVTSRTDLY